MLLIEFKHSIYPYAIFVRCASMYPPMRSGCRFNITLFYRAILIRLRIHEIRSHRILDSVGHVVSRMKKVAMLEHENTTTLWHNVYLPGHVIIVEAGGTSFELAFGIVKVQVESEVRAFLPIRGLI